MSSGEINAQRNNAKKYWNAGAWASTARTDLVNLSLPTEKDYLYFGADGGRYVNNGRADGFSPVTPEDEPNNLDTDNPGYKINLDMKHAMAMVSFRVYDGGRLSGLLKTVTGILRSASAFTFVRVLVIVTSYG